MLPHAAQKSPLFIEGGAGEWSGDDVHASVHELVPEFVLIARGTQRRRTFDDRAQSLDILLGEEQIVRTRFY